MDEIAPNESETDVGYNRLPHLMGESDTSSLFQSKPSAKCSCEGERRKLRSCNLGFLGNSLAEKDWNATNNCGRCSRC